MLISLRHVCKRLSFTGWYIIIAYFSILIILRISGSYWGIHHCSLLSSKFCMSVIISICLVLVLKLSCHDSQTGVLDVHTSVNIHCNCITKHKSLYPFSVFVMRPLYAVSINCVKFTPVLLRMFCFHSHSNWANWFLLGLISFPSGIYLCYTSPQYISMNMMS